MLSTDWQKDNLDRIAMAVDDDDGDGLLPVLAMTEHWREFVTMDSQSSDPSPKPKSLSWPRSNGRYKADN